MGCAFAEPDSSHYLCTPQIEEVMDHSGTLSNCVRGTKARETRLPHEGGSAVL